MTLSQFEALSESDREWHLAKWSKEHDEAICGTCGQPVKDCSDPERDWFPQLSICYRTREQLAALWRFGALHEKRPFHDGTFTSWSEERDAAHPYRYDDGVTIWAADTDYELGGDFLN